jgi:hypothetical protein
VQQGVNQAALLVVRFKRGIESGVQRLVKRMVDAPAICLHRGGSAGRVAKAMECAAAAGRTAFVTGAISAPEGDEKW